MRTRLFLVLAVALLMAPDTAKDEAAKKEYEKLTGTWKIVSLQIEGTNAETDDIKEMRLVLQGDHFTLKQGGTDYNGTYKVDPTRKPKTIDVFFTDGPEKGNTAYGIYELDGDTYKVCISMTGKERPKEFASKAGSGHVVEVFKRVKE
jgi:uncharacterized protein (TIGR03067 family)